MATFQAPPVCSSVAASARLVGLLALCGLLMVGAEAQALRGRSPKSGTSRPPILTGPKLAQTAPPMAPARPDATAAPTSGDTVAVIEYRNDVKQLADLADRLAEALRQNTSIGVINLAEARRRLGAGIDAEVARCDGETRCLASVGEKLAVKEVLLLAVSQLGDVVLALQRIDTKEQRVVSRYADSLSNGVQVEEARLLNWLQQLYPPETFKRYGQMRIVTDVVGAQVYVNAKPRGQTPLSEPLSVLAPGNYRLLVEKDRYLPFQASLTVMPDTVVEVKAGLVKENQQQPWYRRWYVWTGIGAGLAAVAATSVAIYYGTAQPPPDMTHVPGVIVIR